MAIPVAASSAGRATSAGSIANVPYSLVLEDQFLATLHYLPVAFVPAVHRPAPVPTTTTTVPPTTTTTDPGTLPQTTELPSAADPRFASEMTALWDGIVSASVAAALPAYFPESAYVQLKTIAAPTADWTNRLVATFGLDVGAAHALLGPDAATAQLDRVDVTASYAHWVPPGVCDNRVGYYEMPNARVVYTEDGQVRSFGVASMISWRGLWYVVHLGAVLRPSAVGVVDDPQVGPGTPAWSGTC